MALPSLCLPGVIRHTRRLGSGRWVCLVLHGGRFYWDLGLSRELKHNWGLGQESSVWYSVFHVAFWSHGQVPRGTHRPPLHANFLLSP